MRRHSKTADDTEVDLTPMLDIVFILLIFFIVTSVFVKEQALNLTPPPPANNSAQSEPKPTILIRISEDSLVYVNRRLTDVGSVRASIERQIAENPDSAVLVQAHPRAKNKLVIMMVDQARSAGVANVGFTVDSQG